MGRGPFKLRHWPPGRYLPFERLLRGRAAFDGSEVSLNEGETVPVVEERLKVGKRDVSHGRVRVRSYVHFPD